VHQVQPLNNLRTNKRNKNDIINRYVSDDSYSHVGNSNADPVNAKLLLVAITMMLHDWPTYQICPEWSPFDKDDPDNVILEAWQKVHASMSKSKSRSNRIRIIKQNDLAQLLICLASWYFDLDIYNGLWQTRDLVTRGIWRQIEDPNHMNNMGLPPEALDTLARCFIVRRPPLDSDSAMEPRCTRDDFNRCLEKRQELRDHFGLQYSITPSRKQRLDMFVYLPRQLEWWYSDNVWYDKKLNQYGHLPAPGTTLGAGDPKFRKYRDVEVGTVVLISNHQSRMTVTRYWCKLSVTKNRLQGLPETPPKPRLVTKNGKETEYYVEFKNEFPDV